MKTMKNQSMFNRRGFIKRGALFLPAIFLPRIGDNPIVVELFNRDGSEVFHVPRSCGLQAASVIKARTFSSVVDNRIRLTNSNFARLWSTDVGTSWTTICVGCRMTIEDTGANLVSTPRLAFGICVGTSNIFMDATTTHWLGFYSVDPTWPRVSGSPATYAMADATTAPLFSKRITSTITSAGTQTANPRLCDCSTANRSAFFMYITKGSPNFTGSLFCRGGTTASDVSLAEYLAALPLSSPSITNHSNAGNVTLAIDEGANGSFNAVNIAWDRTSPAIELSDLAVVKLA